MLRSSLLPLALAAALGACGDDLRARPDAPTGDGRPPPPSGPFDTLPLTKDLVAPVGMPVHAARDRYGVMHIQAATVRDLGYAQGYVMAHDRLAQMDILRRFGDGTLAELFGGVNQGSIETDLQMRMHRMKPLAEQTWATLQASTDPDDVQVVALLTGFADGVNAVAKELQEGKLVLDPAITTLAPLTFRPWSPIDSLVLGRFQALSLSFTAPLEILLTRIYQGARQRFDQATAADPAAFARRGVSADLMTVTPPGQAPTIDGFPNVDVDTGTRSDAGRPISTVRAAASAPRPKAARAARARRSAVKQPTTSLELLSNAVEFFAPRLPQGPQAFMVPHAGSNDWVVGPAMAGGKALLAGDQHLSLPNPSIFYPVHLTVPGELDVFGQTFPGIPGVILGANGKAAWSSTVVFHDVNDVYDEHIHACAVGGGDCVTHNGAEVPLETRTETFKIGVLGSILREMQVTYEVVPHHGPLIPKIENGMVVPRTGDALSIRYTGYDPTFEIRALWRLGRAKTVDDGFAALRDFSYGGQNWVLIDDQGDIGWTSNAKVPLRAPAAYTWNPATNPDGLAPWFVLPADGSADWQGYLSSRYVPHAINPAQGFLATANSDPVGATFDGDPLNGPVVDGRPLYVGVTYAAGLRSERIVDRIRDAATRGPVTLEDLAAIQHDSRSNAGFHLRDAVVAALAYVGDSTGAPPDVAGYLNSLTTEERARLIDAHARLAAWTLETPTGLGAATPAQQADSSATAIWNVTMHYFFEKTLGDEFAAMTQNVFSLDENFLVRLAQRMLVQPSTMVPSATSGQPILCDDMNDAGADQSCTRKVMEATLAALTQLDTLMGSTDPASWRWGKLHTLTLKPLAPEPRLELPAPDSAQAGGYPKPGDEFAVNRADCGWEDLDFSQDADGPAQRFLAEAEPGKPIRMRFQHPGGVVFDRSSKHYKDLLENTYLAQTHVDVPFSIPEIVAAGEERWVFRQ
ncbi:MAG: penicillin acylase family protein [Kofleriaceae bacterium]